MQAANGAAGGAVAEAVLVTGAAGRIGTAVCRLLTGQGTPVTAMIMDGQQPPTAADGAPACRRVVTGDTTDPDAVARAFEGAAAVVHLAAYTGPNAAPSREVFVNNVASTFTVLHQAGKLGLRRAVLASSINASGLPMNRHPVDVAYYPVDEDLPSDLEDPYSLSKQTDEATARMVSRRFGTTTVAFRFPLTTSRERLLEAADSDPGGPAIVREGWSYLDVRDAARAVGLALVRPLRGAHAMLVAADDVRVPYRTEDLLDAYAPDVPRRRAFAGAEVPLDLGRVRSLLGFRPEHPLGLVPGPLPGR